MYNLLSIGIGFLAWGLAIAAIVRRGSHVLGYFSMSATAVAMVVQFVQYLRLARIEDVSALLDTAGGRLFGAAVLVTVSVLLNGVNLWLKSRKD